MKRRDFIRMMGITGIAGLAGCAGESDDIQDSDGDGVIDSEDYAPQDPDVQEKSDLLATATPVEQTITTTPTRTPTATPTPTQTSTPTRDIGDRTIQANYQPLKGKATGYFKSFSVSQSVVELVTDEMSIPDKYNQYRFGVAALQYPEGDVLTFEKMDARYVGSGVAEVTLNHEFDTQAFEREPFQFAVFVYSPDKSFSEAAEQGEAEDFAYTDRLVIDNNQLTKRPHLEDKNTLDTEQYLRASGEGAYIIEVTGQVSFGFTVFKAPYVKYQEKNPKRGITVIRNAVRDGLAGTFAEIIHDSAESAGRESARQKVNYVVDAIQSLPYVSDSVENGYNDINKYPIETMVEAGGDCEDTAILLAAVLRAEPFGYGTALIYLPSDDPIHAATGVKGDEDVVGSYYKMDGERYYYTETTGEGWELGELPNQYKDYSANVQIA